MTSASLFGLVFPDVLGPLSINPGQTSTLRGVYTGDVIILKTKKNRNRNFKNACKLSSLARKKINFSWFLLLVDTAADEGSETIDNYRCVSHH